jgi:hypothetical protein
MLLFKMACFRAGQISKHVAFPSWRHPLLELLSFSSCFCLQIGTNNNNSDFFITLILKLQETLKQMAAEATQLQQLHRAALDQ